MIEFLLLLFLNEIIDNTATNYIKQNKSILQQSNGTLEGWTTTTK